MAVELFCFLKEKKLSRIFTKRLSEAYNIIVITSFGAFCGGRKSPSVYTRVSAYIDWIESKVWAHEQNWTEKYSLQAKVSMSRKISNLLKSWYLAKAREHIFYVFSIWM